MSWRKRSEFGWIQNKICYIYVDGGIQVIYKGKNINKLTHALETWKSTLKHSTNCIPLFIVLCQTLALWLDTWALLLRSVSPRCRQSLSSIMHIVSHQLYVCLINICVTCTSLQAVIFYSHIAMNNLSQTTTTSNKPYAIHCISLGKRWA